MVWIRVIQKLLQENQTTCHAQMHPWFRFRCLSYAWHPVDACVTIRLSIKAHGIFYPNSRIIYHKWKYKHRGNFDDHRWVPRYPLDLESTLVQLSWSYFSNREAAIDGSSKVPILTCGNTNDDPLLDYLLHRRHCHSHLKQFQQMFIAGRESTGKPVSILL